MDRLLLSIESRLQSPELLRLAITNAGDTHDLLTTTDQQGKTLIAFPLFLSLPPPIAPDGLTAVFVSSSPSSDKCIVSVAFPLPDGESIVVDLPKRLNASVLWMALFRAGLVSSPDFYASNPFRKSQTPNLTATTSLSL